MFRHMTWRRRQQTIRRCAIALVFVLGSLPVLGSATSERTTNALPCLRIAEPIKLDGTLDERCWQRTATATGFANLEGGYVPAARRTTARFAYDDKHLYVAVVCFDSAEQAVLANAKNRDGPVFDDDCVELFMVDDADPTVYYHFAINALGTEYDGRVLDSTWNAPITVATQRLADRWTLEAAIPHDAVGAPPPQSGKTRRFNVARGHRLAGQTPAFSTWSILSSGSFHLPEQFAWLRYTDKPIDPALLEITNLRQPVVSDFAPAEDSPHSRWELAPGTEHQPEVYLSDVFTIRSRSGGWIARQSTNLFPVGGAEFKAILEAKGTGVARIGMRARFETTDGTVRELPVFEDVQLAAEYVVHEKTVTLPDDAHRLLGVELYRTNGRGEVECRRVGLTLSTDTFTGIREAADSMADHRLPISEPAPAIDPVRWAPSLPDGPLRVLCILDGLVQRGIEELAQRFDMTYDLVWSNGGSYHAYDADAINRRLSRQGEPYDVILVSAVIQDPALIQTIEANARAGTGLVFLTGPDLSAHDPAMLALLPDAELLTDTDDAPIVTSVPWQYFPTVPDNYIVGPNAAEPAIKRIGIGDRAVTLVYGGPAGTYNGIIPYTGLNETNLEHWWEYAYSLLGKSLLHSSGRLPMVGNARVRPQLDKKLIVVELADNVEAPATLRLVWANQPAQVNPPTQTRRIDPSLPTAPITFTVPETVLHRHGLHVANLFLENDGGQTLDWATAAFQVRSATRLSEHRPLPLAVHRDSTTIPATIRIENDGPASSALELSAKLIDSHGRLVWETSQPVTAGAESVIEVKVEIALDRAITVGHAFEVSLSESDVLLDQHAWDVNVPEKGLSFAEDFHPGLYGDFYRRTHTDAVFMRWVRRMGFKFVVEGGVFEAGPRLSTPWFDSGLAHEAFHHHEDGSDRSTRNPCLSDPDYMAGLIRRATAAATHSLERGAVLLSMADEPELVKDGRIELCFCPHCTERFKVWAADHYPSIDLLNTQWGTDYAAWQDIKPITADQARVRGNYAQWVDFRTFMEDVFTDTFKQIRDAIHQQHADALVSLGNPFTLNPFSGSDHYKLAQAEDFYGKYMRPDIIKEYRSFDPSKPMQTHWGYQENLPYTRWFPWYFAMHGGDAMNFYDTFSSRGKYDLFDGTFRHTARSVAVMQTNEDLTAGVGKILSDTPPARTPVAMLYSQNSMKVAWIVSDAEVGREVWGRRIMEQLPVSDPFALHTKSVAQFKSMVKESWLQPDMIAPAQILDGRLASYRLLILPCTMALSEDVLQAIEEFVLKGGTVVADLRLALFDGHGKPTPQRESVRRIFGIKRESEDYISEQAVLSFKYQVSENTPAKSVRVHSPVREQLVATTARVAGRYQSGDPAVTVNELGDGRAVYLNLFTDSGVERQALMNQILQWSGVDQPWKLAADNDPALGYECFEFVQSDTRYLGVLRDMEPQQGQTIEWFDADFRRAYAIEESLTIQSLEPGHVYDVRSGQYLGLTDAFDAVFKQGEAKVFAILPGRIEGVAISGLESQYAPGDRVTFAAEIAADRPIDSVVRIELYGPNDALLGHYTKNVALHDGRYDGVIPLALSDAPGVWTLKLTDVISSFSETVTFTVREPLSRP